MLSMIIDNISSFMYSKLLVIILIGAGVYFTIRTSFPQVRLFHSACKAVGTGETHVPLLWRWISDGAVALGVHGGSTGQDDCRDAVPAFCLIRQ